jgi:hypothetical protein
MNIGAAAVFQVGKTRMALRTVVAWVARVVL